jgi:hypothetical protein
MQHVLSVEGSISSLPFSATEVMTMRCTKMATPSRERVLESAHWTMAVGVFLDVFLSMLDTMVRAPRYIGGELTTLVGAECLHYCPLLRFTVLAFTSRLQRT